VAKDRFGPAAFERLIGQVTTDNALVVVRVAHDQPSWARLGEFHFVTSVVLETKRIHAVPQFQLRVQHRLALLYAKGNPPKPFRLLFTKKTDRDDLSLWDQTFPHATKLLLTGHTDAPEGWVLLPCGGNGAPFARPIRPNTQPELTGSLQISPTPAINDNKIPADS